MAGTATSSQLLVARVVAVVAVVLVVLGLFWYGLSAEVLGRIGRDIAERPGGPMTFRFILQPCMAALAAYHDGAKDARLGRSPYLWSMLTHPQGGSRLREGGLATARIILLGFVMDGIYQAVVLKTFYPGEMVLVAILLAFVPYLLLRGPFCRLARRRSRSM